jgi:LPPG:FO 2-phospho-L-lactate transferase
MGLLGGEDWFRLGDRDLAVHCAAPSGCARGEPDRGHGSPAPRLGVRSTILPMSDAPVRTLVHTDEGDLPFQHYFVGRRCEPCVIDELLCRRDRERADRRGLRTALTAADVIVFCPSNPISALTRF